MSVASNISEGQGRKSPDEFRHFLHNAAGSLMEGETQITISEMLGYIAPVKSKEVLDKSNELGRILNGIMNSLAQA